MTTKPDNAAEDLTGRILKNKWKVLKRIYPKLGNSGGFFSVCYIVSDGEREAFLKAINFKAFFTLFPGRSIIEILQEQTSAFTYEVEILKKCKNKRLTKVAFVMDEGEEYLTEFTIPNVPYLIFELAEGDVRDRFTFSINIEASWKLASLHQVAVGLQQLHYINIGHQDLKPSNVLLYESGIISKLADLGRSLSTDLKAPHEKLGEFTGDMSYAPPEFLYGYYQPDLNLRIRATDMYLFGSLIVFYFTGTNMTALIGKNIDPSFKWDKWFGPFGDIIDYLKDGFYKSLGEFKSGFGNNNLGNELALIVEYCCFPDPMKRGFPKARSLYGNPYDFQRAISKLAILKKKAEMQLI